MGCALGSSKAAHGDFRYCGETCPASPNPAGGGYQQARAPAVGLLHAQPATERLSGEQHAPHAYLNPLGTPRHAFADGAAPKTLAMRP